MKTLDDKMTAVSMDGSGDAGVLRSETRARPVPAPNEVLIKVVAAGVNGPDLMQRRGLYPPPRGASDLLGLEVSGEIVATGALVSRWQIGDRVVALTNGGGYAEYVAVIAEHCLPLPPGVDAIDGAGLPEALFTIWSNVFYQHSVPDDARFLIHGGSGGIGSAAIQLATAFGYEAFTTAGSDESCAWCEKLGATRAINYNTEDFVEITRAAGGADIIIDIIGGDYIARNIKAARADARIIQLAFNHGSKVELDLMPLMLKRLSVTGSTLRSRPDAFKAAIAAEIEQKLWPLFTAGKLRATTFKCVPLSEASKAHRLMESGNLRGKILLSVA